MMTPGFQGIGDAPGERGAKRSMLSRALAILCQFEPTDGDLSLTELSRRAHLSKPTAHRLVAELVQWGLLERTRSGLRLGERLSVLGSRVQRHRALRDAAAPLLVRMSETTGGCAYLSVWQDDGAVQLDRFGRPAFDERERANWERISAIAATNAIAAFDRGVDPSPVPEQRRHNDLPLTTVRSLGYAVVEHGTARARVLGVASPVLVPGSRVVAAVSLVGPAIRCPVAAVAPSVRSAATALGGILAETGERDHAGRRS